MTSSQPGLELVRIQYEAALDGRGRLAECYGVTIASCMDGHAMWIGDEVPDALAEELTRRFERAKRPARPDEAPPVLAQCAQILGGGGALQRRAGPSYVFPADVQYACDATIERSDGPGVDRLRSANPGNWHPVEWDELLDGRLGPWTIIAHGGRAVSVCHTPGPLRAWAAECGVWTDPQHRGRGHAAATAAAWVPLVRAPERQLFYSTDHDNLSSQRVARRLQLREIGWTWRLHRLRSGEMRQWHPLSALRR
jgi:RimJ/RimL family protein N-acetyltransferase